MERNNLNRRIYLIILSDIESESCDIKFAKTIQNRNFEWWRHTALNWILATPVTVSSNDILNYAMDAYGTQFITVLEISINDVAGIFPTTKEQMTNSEIPFVWFHKMNDPNYVPKWGQKDIENNS